MVRVFSDVSNGSAVIEINYWDELADNTLFVLVELYTRNFALSIWRFTLHKLFSLSRLNET
jgi:hypothetical protein